MPNKVNETGNCVNVQSDYGSTSYHFIESKSHADHQTNAPTISLYDTSNGHHLQQRAEAEAGSTRFSGNDQGYTTVSKTDEAGMVHANVRYDEFML